MPEDLIPLLAFFVAFFVVFSLIELLIIIVLNHLGTKHWAFVIDKLIRAKVHHGRFIQFIAMGGIIIVLAFIWFLTPFFSVMGAATPLLKTFSIILLIVMIVIYFVTTKKMTRMALEKKVHQYIYFVISIIVFAFVIIMMNKSYNAYQNYINKQFVETIAQDIQSAVHKKERDRLITQFKEDYLAGKCSEVDYTKDLKDGFTHFFYIEIDPSLSSENIIPDEEGMPNLKGHKCTDGKNTFLLNEEGKWYWVIKENAVEKNGVLQKN